MAEGKRVLMKDVAAKAGVHQTTVSLALRGHKGIPEKNRKRICKIAEEMGYRPDPVMRALNSYRKRVQNKQYNQTIGYIVNLENDQDIQLSHVYRKYLENAKARSEELGYKLELFKYGKNAFNSRTLDRILKARGIKGIIIGAFTYLNADIELDWDNYAAVKLELLPVDIEIDAVLSNQMFSVRLAMRKLREELGIKRMGLAVAEHDEIHNRNLFTAGYLIGQRHIPMEDRIPPLVFNIESPNEIFSKAKSWAKEHEVEAIISNWNSFDLVAWELTEESGKPCRFVPLDANELTRKYGGIDQNHGKVARWAVDLLDGKLTSFKQGIPETHGITLVDPSWIPFGKCEVGSPKPKTQQEFMVSNTPQHSSFVIIDHEDHFIVEKR